MTAKSARKPQEDGDFWRGRRVAVTGRAGFLGSHETCESWIQAMTSEIEREAALVPAFAR